jgi:hypothetical protein
MNRDARLYARTTSAVRKKLERFAKKQGLSLSSAIQSILADFLDGRYVARRNIEKRHYKRKSLSLPALVKPTDTAAARPERATILDLSIAGLSLSMERESLMSGKDRGNGSQFEAAFVLPHVRKPIRILCRRERALAVGRSLTIGASFIDADLERYQHLERYLHEED